MINYIPWVHWWYFWCFHNAVTLGWYKSPGLYCNISFSFSMSKLNSVLYVTHTYTCTRLCCQIRAAEIIASDQYKTGHTLRFPRVEKIRSDKPWYDCMTTVELDDLRQVFSLHMLHYHCWLGIYHVWIFSVKCHVFPGGSCWSWTVAISLRWPSSVLMPSHMVHVLCRPVGAEWLCVASTAVISCCCCSKQKDSKHSAYTWKCPGNTMKGVKLYDLAVVDSVLMWTECTEVSWEAGGSVCGPRLRRTKEETFTCCEDCQAVGHGTVLWRRFSNCYKGINLPSVSYGMILKTT